MRENAIRLALAAVAALALPACSAGGEKAPETTTLIYAVLSEEGVHRADVNRFNLTHMQDGVRIEIREYFDEDGRSGRDRLLTEMASGKIPDIIDLGSSEYGLSYQQLVRKGYLEDLWPYINNDPELNNGQLLEAPLKAAEVNGGLYTIFNKVGISTLVGEERVVGNRYSWSLAELREAFASMPDESTVLEYYLTKSDMFSYVFRLSLDSYLDWETGEDSFDSDNFRVALEFVNSFPDAFPGLDFEGGLQKAKIETGDRVREGRQMLSMQEITIPADVQALDIAYGHREKVAFIGYPTENGSAGSVFIIQGRKLAMSSICQEKEAAWEFLREMLLPKLPNLESAFKAKGIPLNHVDLEMVMKVFTDPPDYISGKYYDFFDETTDFNAPDFLFEPSKLPGIKVISITSAEAARFEDFINHVDKIDLYDTELYDIVYEACGPYLAGDRDMDETIQVIRNKVKIYWNENR